MAEGVRPLGAALTGPQSKQTATIRSVRDASVKLSSYRVGVPVQSTIAGGRSFIAQRSGFAFVPMGADSQRLYPQVRFGADRCQWRSGDLASASNADRISEQRYGSRHFACMSENG